MRAVDLFAGWGGFTSGAEQAGVEVVWAANHWPLAVQAHAANHPGATHHCQDLRQADWSRLPQFELLLASPACQGHSSAAQPLRRRSQAVRIHHNALRSTATAVIDCASVTRPQNIIVENVPMFERWEMYKWWLDGLRTLGYRVSTHVVCASHHGVPQRRRRLFVVARMGSEFRYIRPSSTKPEPAFGPCIDWKAGRWRPTETLKPGAAKRVAQGRAKHGRRFLTQHVTGHPGVPLHEAIRTITTKDQWAVVDGDQYRPLTVRETARAMGFCDSYTWPDATRRDKISGLGNAVCPPVARDLIGQVLA